MKNITKRKYIYIILILIITSFCAAGQIKDSIPDKDESTTDIKKDIIKITKPNNINNINDIRTKIIKDNIIDKINPSKIKASKIQMNIILTILIIILVWLTRFIVIKIVWNRTESIKTRYQWRKTSGYVTLSINMLFIAIIWVKGFESFATILGIVSAGLIFLLRDPVLNFTGWIFIISQRRVEVGDRIQIDQFAGDVVDINLFYFTIMEIGNWVKADQSTGRIIHVPNSFILNKSLINYSKGLEFLWNEIPVVVTFESDWEKAKKLLENIINKYEKNMSHKAEKKVKEAARRYFISYSKFSPILYTDVIEYGIRLTIRYLCEPRERRDSEAELWENVLRTYSKHNDISFAYPTQRFYDNHIEGKAKGRSLKKEKRFNK